jgi:hypothetical protein
VYVSILDDGCFSVGHLRGSCGPNKVLREVDRSETAAYRSHDGGLPVEL